MKRTQPRKRHPKSGVKEKPPVVKKRLLLAALNAWLLRHHLGNHQ